MTQKLLWIGLGAVIITVVVILLLIILPPNPNVDKILPGLELVVLTFTLVIYAFLLIVSNKTLSFTQKQTSFNMYFDNYKLFNDLSKRKTGIVLDDELIFEMKPYFENMTFESIHLSYLTILDNFPLDLQFFTIEKLFIRFNYRNQSFLSILHKEINKIKKDDKLSSENRITLIDLYKNFILFDYINLCAELIISKEVYDEKGQSPIPHKNYFKCNTNRTVFKWEEFRKLYDEIKD